MIAKCHNYRLARASFQNLFFNKDYNENINYIINIMLHPCLLLWLWSTCLSEKKEMHVNDEQMLLLGSFFFSDF